MPARSRPARCRGPIASPSTTSCCGSRRILGRPRATPAARRSSTCGDGAHGRIRTRSGSSRVRWLAIVFVALIVALQYPMWLGKGGWLQVRETDRQLAAQREANARLKARNDGLDAEVRDLKTGFEAIEERA